MEGFEELLTMFLDCKDNVYISGSEFVSEVDCSMACVSNVCVQVGYDWGQWGLIAAPPWGPNALIIANLYTEAIKTQALETVNVRPKL